MCLWCVLCALPSSRGGWLTYGAVPLTVLCVRLFSQRQLESALFALCCLLGEPTVVPGGGCLEVLLLSQLRQFVSKG